MQRAINAHVDTEQEWISTIKMVSHLLQVINLTVQVASSSREVLLEAIKEAHTVCFPVYIHSSLICFLFRLTVLLTLLGSF